jgi:hypothetical protein
MVANCYVGGAAMENVWTKETIHEMLQSLSNSTTKGTYGVDVAKELRDLIKSKMDISGKSVLIIGSERPWLEVITLYAGVLKVITLNMGELSRNVLSLIHILLMNFVVLT